MTIIELKNWVERVEQMIEESIYSVDDAEVSFSYNKIMIDSQNEEYILEDRE